MMRGWLAAGSAAIVVISLCLCAGCKGGAGTATSTQPPSPAKSAKAEGKAVQTKRLDKEGAGEEVDAIAKLLASDTATDQVTGLNRLLQIKSKADRDSLRAAVRKLCSSDAPEIQAGALSAWAPWAAEDPEPALKVAQSPHASVRLAAIQALSVASPSIAQPVLTKLKNDEDSTVAARAVAALADLLGASKEDAAIDTLIADLGHPESDRSAQAGMRLEQAGRVNRRVVDRLMAALQRSQNAHQRMSCVVVIGLTCSGTSEGQQKFTARTKATYRMDINPAPAYTVPVPLLMKVLVSDPDPTVREAAAEALGHLGAPESATALAKALKDRDAMVRRRAAASLIVVPGDPVKDDLMATAKEDSSPEVRRFVVEAMAGLPDQREAGLAVANCLRDADADVRRYACEVLGRIGTKQFTPALLPLFDDPDEDVRWKAVEAVASFVDPEAKKPFSDALWDPSPRVALAAEKGLHSLGIGKRMLTAAERTGPMHKSGR